MRQGRLLAVIGVLVFLLAGIYTLPASLLAARLPGTVRMTGVSGTVWNGQATGVTANGLDLGTVNWQGSLLRALTGRLDFAVTAATEGGAHPRVAR